MFGVELSTIPPNSQGYLTLGAARLAEHLGLPDDPDDPQWAHLLVECAVVAGFDRPDVLSDQADGPALLRRIEQRVGDVDPSRASRTSAPASDGDTTYLCTADGNGMAVSLIQSNASGFGSWLAEPNTGIGLHNRGIGFTLTAGHPAELTARKASPTHAGPGRGNATRQARRSIRHDGWRRSTADSAADRGALVRPRSTSRRGYCRWPMGVEGRGNGVRHVDRRREGQWFCWRVTPQPSGLMA